MAKDLVRSRTYKGFNINLLGDGFEPSETAQLISTMPFIVSKEDDVAVFAFGVKYQQRLTDQLGNGELIEKASKIIEAYIDNGQVKHLEEYTFEYDGMDFAEVDNPKWWKKALANLLGEER